MTSLELATRRLRMAIAAHAGGHKNTDIAERFDVSHPTASRAREEFQSNRDEIVQMYESKNHDLDETVKALTHLLPSGHYSPSRKELSKQIDGINDRLGRLERTFNQSHRDSCEEDESLQSVDDIRRHIQELDKILQETQERIDRMENKLSSEIEYRQSEDRAIVDMMNDYFA